MSVGLITLNLSTPELVYTKSQRIWRQTELFVDKINCDKALRDFSFAVLILKREF
jgi:hypothetical protein